MKRWLIGTLVFANVVLAQAHPLFQVARKVTDCMTGPGGRLSDQRTVHYANWGHTGEWIVKPCPGASIAPECGVATMDVDEDGDFDLRDWQRLYLTGQAVFRQQPRKAVTTQ